MKKNKKCYLSIGKIIISLECPTETFAHSMRTYFKIPAEIIPKPDISLNLKIISHKDEPELPESLFTTKVIQPKGFSIGDDLVKGYFDPLKRKGEIKVKSILTEGPLTRIFEQLLYQAFYSAQKLNQYDGWLIHSAGVIAGGNGYLFVGPSGSGKSTIANLSKPYAVLNDEINHLSFEEGMVFLHGTPFNGYYQNKVTGKAPLKAIFLLKHGKAFKLGNICENEAITAIFKEIVPPIGLEEAITKNTYTLILDLASRLYSANQINILEFYPDKSVWADLLQAFDHN